MTPDGLTVQAGLHPTTWADCAAVIAENDPLQEGADGLKGADLVCVGYVAGAPAGFVAGFSQQGLAVCSFVRLRRPWFGSRMTVRALFEAWAAQVRARGHTTIVAGVPREPAAYRRAVEIMLTAAGFTLYHDGDTERDWFRAAVPPARSGPAAPAAGA